METQSDDSQIGTTKTDFCINVLKRKASQVIEITEENTEETTIDNTFYEDVIPSTSSQCMSSVDESCKNFMFMPCVSLSYGYRKEGMEYINYLYE